MERRSKQLNDFISLLTIPDLKLVLNLELLRLSFNI